MSVSVDTADRRTNGRAITLFLFFFFPLPFFLRLCSVYPSFPLMQERLNITDISMPVAAAAPGAAAGGAAAESGEEAEEEEKPKEKTIFAIKLKGLKDASAKAKVIKEVKTLNSSMSLVEAKKFVEGAPQILKDNVPKEDAEKIIAAIEKAGGEAEMV